jgi:hypothetical protein
MSAIRQVVEKMDRLISGWDAAGDYRSVFVRSYRAITVRMERAVNDREFEDNPWMEALDVRFAQEYFDALDAVEAGRAGLPACWKVAFDLARDRRTLVIQDLLLGMNAHILHDLPLTLFKAGLAPQERALRQRDHERVNEVLKGMIDDVQRDISRHYSVALGFLDRGASFKDEILTDAGIRVARAKAWTTALALADAPDAAARAALLGDCDRAIAASASLLVPPRSWLSGLVPRFRKWDRALATALRR